VKYPGRAWRESQEKNISPTGGKGLFIDSTTQRRGKGKEKRHGIIVPGFRGERGSRSRSFNGKHVGGCWLPEVALGDDAGRTGPERASHQGGGQGRTLLFKASRVGGTTWVLLMKRVQSEGRSKEGRIEGMHARVLIRVR